MISKTETGMEGCTVRNLMIVLLLMPALALAAPPNLALDWTGTASGADFLRLTCGGVDTDDPTPPVQLTDAGGAYVLAGAADGVSCTLVGVNTFGAGLPSGSLYIGVPSAAPVLTVITQ